MTYNQGDKVEYDVEGMKGSAIVVGIATTPQMVFGTNYILQDLSGNFPNKAYSYTNFVCFECWMKPA